VCYGHVTLPVHQAEQYISFLPQQHCTTACRTVPGAPSCLPSILKRQKSDVRRIQIDAACHLRQDSHLLNDITLERLN